MRGEYENVFFILTGSVYFWLSCSLAAAEICPAPCICRRSKSSSAGSGDPYFTAQCGGANNKITSLEEIDLSGIASNLVQLDLSSNSLTSLTLNINFPVLQKLDLSKNKFLHLEPNVLKNLPNLRMLDISSNSLKTINKDLFTGLNKLERLKLSGNQITTINRGTFDDLIHLKKLDISNNPLTCDCDLLWLLDWIQTTAVKFTTAKCAAPPSFKGQPLRKLKIGVEIHCRSPVSNHRETTDIDLKPERNQVTYEGDNIKIRCRAPGVTPDMFHSGDDPYSSVRIYWRFNLEDPLEKFRDVKVEQRSLDDSGMLDSVLNIGIISRNHSGQWTCHLSSEKGNYSKSISLFVISNSTKYCPSIVTTNNKGTYIWPRTPSDTIVEQPCQGQQLSDRYHMAQAIHYCSEFTTWRGLNTTSCPYISEVTKILEQFSKVNLNLTKGNLLESARHLKNYTTDASGGKLLRDTMDIVFIARTIENYVMFVSTEHDLGDVLMDTISSLLNLNKKLLEDAQIEDRSCSRLIHAVETISVHASSAQLKSNIAVDHFTVEAFENFKGLTCAWYSNNRAKRLAKSFFCSISNDLPYMTYEDKLIEASIQIPASLFVQIHGQLTTSSALYQLIVAMYDSSKLFPNFQMKEVVTSPIVGAILVERSVENLTDPVTVMYRYPLYQDVETPTLAWWDNNQNGGLGGWNKNGCELSHYFHESLIFSCDRLNYFAMLQDVQYAPTSFITGGAKFHFSHPAIYTGTFLLILGLFITIVTYLLCFNSIQMARRAKHALINTWVAISLLVYIFTFGVYQTEDVQLCQIIGVILHYLSLSVLLWMCVSVTTMYKRVSKSIHLPVDELPPTAVTTDEPPVQKPILGLYLVGWGIASIVCGISAAINIREYASHTYCFLYSGPALSAVFVPAVVLIAFIVVCSLMIRCAIQCSDVHGQLSEGTQATENVDLDLLEPNLPSISIDRHSYRSISSQTASSNIEDPEHCPSKQLKAHMIVLVLYLFLWTIGALSVRKIFKNHLPYEERVFSISFAVLAGLLGAFVLFFYGIARSDVRSKWGHVKRVWCRTRSISDTNLNPPQSSVIVVQTSPPPPPPHFLNSGLVSEINNSRSSSRTSSHPKSQNSNILKAAVDLNNVNLNDPEAEAKIANVNLVVLHRQQYRTNNTIPFYNDSAEMFYNPQQSTVARKFFRKQRKNMIKHNNLGTTSRRHRSGITPGDTSDNASCISYPKVNTDIKNTNIFGSGTKINNINIHVEPVKEVKQQNKNILSESGDEESEILIDHVTGSVSRILAEREKALQKKKHNDAVKEEVMVVEERDESPPLQEMRTVSQQCSLEYSTDDSSPGSRRSDDDPLNATLQNEEAISFYQPSNDEEDVIIAESIECNLTPENNEGMYSITDLSQNLRGLLPDDSCSSIQNDFDDDDDEDEGERRRLYPGKTIYTNLLHEHLMATSASTIDSDVPFTLQRYQPTVSDASIVHSGGGVSDVEDERRSSSGAPGSPVSVSELDALYEQINRNAPEVMVHSRPSRSRSPILFPPSVSFESGLDHLMEVNTDYRFNAQGVVDETVEQKTVEDDDDGDDIKVETTV